MRSSVQMLSVGGVVALALSSLAHAAPTLDAAGDLINGFSAATSPDLDVLQIEAFFDTTTSNFVFTSTSAGAIGTTAGASFVWGINRGAGTAGFAANGVTNVLFDRVVQITPGGLSRIAGGGLPAINLDPGAITINGSTIRVVIAASLLPSTGFLFSDYSVALWPRSAAQTGFTAIADFAPNNSNIGVTLIPAPAGLAAMLAAGCVGARRRRVAMAA